MVSDFSISIVLESNYWKIVYNLFNSLRLLEVSGAATKCTIPHKNEWQRLESIWTNMWAVHMNVEEWCPSVSSVYRKKRRWLKIIEKLTTFIPFQFAKEVQNTRINGSLKEMCENSVWKCGWEYDTPIKFFGPKRQNWDLWESFPYVTPALRFQPLDWGCGYGFRFTTI